MKDKDGNEVEMKGSINNLFDGMDDTFVEIANGMGLELTLESQVKLMGLIIKMKQGVTEPKSGLENGRRMITSIARAGKNARTLQCSEQNLCSLNQISVSLSEFRYRAECIRFWPESIRF